LVILKKRPTVHPTITYKLPLSKSTYQPPENVENPRLGTTGLCEYSKTFTFLLAFWQ